MYTQIKYAAANQLLYATATALAVLSFLSWRWSSSSSCLRASASFQFCCLIARPSGRTLESEAMIISADGMPHSVAR